MTRVTVSREINAPAEHVFATIADIGSLPDKDPDVLRVEFVGTRRQGVGTRFREVRAMKRRELVTELEVTEYEPGERIRMVTDSHGTVWDTVYRVSPTRGGAAVSISMDARAHKLLPRLLNPLMKGMFRKGMQKHLESLQAYCERPRA